MRALKIALWAAAIGAAALFVGSGTASAMPPVGGLKAASSDLSDVQDVRYRRWRRYYAAPYAYRPYAYAYSPYYAYYGWPYYRPYWGYGWGWGAFWW
jgi:hypothetical protein